MLTRIHTQRVTKISYMLRNATCSLRMKPCAISSIKPTIYGILYTISNQNTKKLAHVLRSVYTQLHQQRYSRTRQSLTFNNAVSGVSYRTLTITKTCTIHIRGRKYKYVKRRHGLQESQFH